MELRPITAADGPKTAGPYAHAINVCGAKEVLFIGGQMGFDANRVTPPSFEEQARNAFINIDRQLRAAGMTKENLVKVTVYLADCKYRDGMRDARNAYLGGHQIAFTCVVTGIIDEQWFLEIEAYAAR
ncbi:MAG: RidA family protein [Hyphomicrobiaceae bacterium]